jgi:hypothetical protein
MDRISSPTAVPDAHGPGKNGFTDGNPLAGILATYLNALWFTGTQEEMVGIIEHLGLTPDAETLTQLRQALSRWIGGAVRTVTGDVTLTADDAGLVLVSAAGGNVALTLPEADAANGRPLRFVIIRTDTSANTVTIAPQGADTLNGLTGPHGIPRGASLMLVGDGSAAWRLAGAAGFGLITVLSSSGTTDVPWWARRAEVRVWGGGGGGGFGGATGAGGGGAAGTPGMGTYAVTPGDSIAITVGTGGAAGTAAGVHGAAGGTSSFGSLLTAPGGGGGGSTASGNGTAGTPGAPATGGSFSSAGAGGGTGMGAAGIGGAGGSSIGGGPGGHSYTGPGRAGMAPGGAGSGGGNNNAGGAGGVGWVEITWRA